MSATASPAGEDRYEASVANIRETVKWLIGSVGAVFVTLLAGVQFSDVPFASRPEALVAAAAAAASVMVTFGLAIATLVGGGMSFGELATARRFARTRRFIDANWADPPQPGLFERFCASLRAEDAKWREKAIRRDDEYYAGLRAQADLLLCAGRWHVVKLRFQRLVVAMLLLVPIQLGAAGVMFAQPEPRSQGTTLTVELKSAG